MKIVWKYVCSLLFARVAFKAWAALVWEWFFEKGKVVVAWSAKEKLQPNWYHTDVPRSPGHISFFNLTHMPYIKKSQWCGKYKTNTSSAPYIFHISSCTILYKCFSWSSTMMSPIYICCRAQSTKCKSRKLRTTKEVRFYVVGYPWTSSSLLSKWLS